MPHTGVFTSLGNESNLDDGTDDFLILKDGVPDENAAKTAATSFLKDVKKFHQQQTITVEGGTSSLGSVRTILMTNASDATPSGLAPSKAGPGAGKKGKKKTGSAKKTTKSSSKKTAKAKSSKKKKTVKKPGAKSSTKTKGRKSASKTARKKAKRV